MESNRIRENLAAATFARNAEVTALEVECRRLYLRLAQTIMQMTLHLTHDQLTKVAGYLLLITE